jgi:hypothetical protein
MALELKNEEDTWTISDAELLAGGDKDTSYTVRRLTLDKHREITKKHTKPATYRKAERRDEAKIQDDLFDYVLTGWKGVIAKGAPLPCTWEYKRLIDTARRIALLDEAGMNDVAAAEGARAESFPGA